MRRSRPNQWPIKPDERAFWDPQFQREYMQRFPPGHALTKAEFDYLIDRGANATDLMNRVPAGLGPQEIMDILLNEIREMKREIRVLQDDKIDKILLVE